MKIGLVMPHIYFLPDISKESIFAPGQLFSEVANGLIKKGHEVKIFASGEVENQDVVNIIGDTSALRNAQNIKKLSALELQRKHPIIFKKVYEKFQEDILNKVYSYLQKDNLDLIHIFAVDNPRILEFTSNIPVVYTNHDPYNFNKILKKAFQENKDKQYISISNSQRETLPELNFIKTVYNSINLSEFEFNDSPQDYFAYLGRIIYPKGVHRAIEVAKRLKVKLKIAGKHYTEFNDPYFKDSIEPFIDNKQIIYNGFINNPKEKSDFLKNAKALLFPIDWQEPFGLVMIEAMACGTPVIAFDRGSVREIIKDGVNGFIVSTKTEMVEAMKNIHAINRKTCRQYVEERFTKEIMIDEYEKVYKKLIS